MPSIGSSPGTLVHTDPTDWAEPVGYAKELAGRGNEADLEDTRLGVKVVKDFISTTGIVTPKHAQPRD